MKIEKQDILEKGKFDSRGARPIANSKVISLIDKTLKTELLFDDKILETFLNNYYEWLKASKLNNLDGLKFFDKLSYVHGTTQSFDFFFLENKMRRMRCFKGDFIYHKVSWKNYFKEKWKFIEEDELRDYDAVIISVPFSDSGSLHPQTENVLNICDDLKIPVLIDCAYYSISNGVNLNIKRPSIDTVTFSLSKPFYGAERLRIGIRCKKNFTDDTVNLFNQFQQINRIGAGIGIELCKSFDTDYNFTNFRDKQVKVCKELNIEPSDSVIFGLAKSDHEEFGDYDRGGSHHRVCISKLLGDCN